MPTSRCWCRRTTSARTSSRCCTSRRCSTCWIACSCCCAKAAADRLRAAAGEPRTDPADAGSLTDDATTMPRIRASTRRWSCVLLADARCSPAARIAPTAAGSRALAARAAAGAGHHRRTGTATTARCSASSATAAAGARSARGAGDDRPRRRGLGHRPARPAQTGGPARSAKATAAAPAGVFAIGEAFGYAASATTALPYARDAGLGLLHRRQRFAAVQPHRRCRRRRRRRGRRLHRTDAPRPACRRRPALPPRLRHRTQRRRRDPARQLHLRPPVEVADRCDRRLHGDGPSRRCSAAGLAATRRSSRCSCCCPQNEYARLRGAWQLPQPGAAIA